VEGNVMEKYSPNCLKRKIKDIIQKYNKKVLSNLGKNGPLWTGHSWTFYGVEQKRFLLRHSGLYVPLALT
jgi:hypothetical protein